jgi:hypothetical protein
MTGLRGPLRFGETVVIKEDEQVRVFIGLTDLTFQSYFEIESECTLPISADS